MQLLKQAGVCLSLMLIGAGRCAMAIDYGTPVADGKYPTVGMVIVNLGDRHTALGTGTLIARNIVLTAAHVIQDAPTPGHITFRTTLGDNQKFESRILVYRTHPGYLNLRSDSLIHDEERIFMDTDLIAASSADLALLLLETPAPGDLSFYPLLNKQPQPGTDVTAVGFGLDEGKQRGKHRKMQGTLQFLKEQDGAVLYRTPKGSNQRTDHGDSGGPLLVTDGEQEKIAAITHGFFTAIKVDGLAPDEYGIYVSMAAHVDWIESTREHLIRYKSPASPAYFLTRNNRRTPFLAVTARQVFSLANADTPIERLVGRAFTRGINEPIPGDVATGWQKRYKLPPGMLIPLKQE